MRLLPERNYTVFKTPVFEDKPRGPLIIIRIVSTTTPVGIEYTHSLADTLFAVTMWRASGGCDQPYIVFCADDIDEAATAVDVIAECVPEGAVTFKRAAVGHPRWTPPAWLIAAPIRWHSTAIV